MKVVSLFGRQFSSLPDPPTEDGPVGHVSRGEQEKAQTASQYSSVYSVHTTHKNKALASDTTKP